LPEQVGPGRPRRYCRQGCRQQAHVARQQAKALGLGDDDLIVSRAAVEELQGALYCLSAALDDVDRDIAAAETPKDLEAALGWLMENARPLASLWIEPRSTF
jgi:hypothetical protein